MNCKYIALHSENEDKVVIYYEMEMGDDLFWLEENGEYEDEDEECKYIALYSENEDKVVIYYENGNGR